MEQIQEQQQQEQQQGYRFQKQSQSDYAPWWEHTQGLCVFDKNGVQQGIITHEELARSTSLNPNSYTPTITVYPDYLKGHALAQTVNADLYNIQRQIDAELENERLLKIQQSKLKRGGVALRTCDKNYEIVFH
jgi:hypothetical protein